MKTCSRCGESKPRTAFSKQAALKDGLKPSCKACVAEYRRQTSEASRAYGQRYRTEHADEIRAYYQKNREAILARHRANYYANREERSAQIARWMAQHKEEFRAYRKRYVADNRERIAAYAKRYRAENREAISAYLAEYDRRTGRSLARKAKMRGASGIDPVSRMEVYRRAGGICGLCNGPVESRDFHVDHILPLSRGGGHSYSNTQPTHPLCNLRKGNRVAA